MVADVAVIGHVVVEDVEEEGNTLSKTYLNFYGCGGLVCRPLRSGSVH